MGLNALNVYDGGSYSLYDRINNNFKKEILIFKFSKQA